MSLSEIELTFALGQRVAHLATADLAGRPHVIPVCFAIVIDCFYFVVDEKPKRSHRALKRLRNMAVNPQVALVVDHYDEDWDRLAYLRVQGEASIVIDVQEYATALEALRVRYAQYRQMRLDQATNPVVRITPSHTHFWRAGGGRTESAS
jgi:PPOX class probable F420-dependent enzyme